ncbi:MAG: hypothetical protein ACM3O9_07095 [Methylocystaceae bacterium]
MTEWLDLRKATPSEALGIIDRKFRSFGVQEITALVGDGQTADGLAKKIGGTDYQVQVAEQGGDYYLNVHKTSFTKQLDGEVSYLLLLGSLALGHGAKELGQKLLINLLEHMAQPDLTPSHLVLTNEAVAMAVSQSPQLAVLEQLAAQGCEILISADSLDYYAHPSQLAIGYTITSLHLAGLLAQAGKVVAL